METNPFLSLKINPDDVSPIVRSVTRLLDDLHLPYEICRNEHISLAYVIGEHKKEEIQEVIKEISEKGISVRISGIEFLEGLTTPFDYIALKITQDEYGEFEYAKGYIKEHFSIKEKFGDKPFAPHISIVKVEKNIISKEDSEYLCRYLETVATDITCKCVVSAKEIELFSKEYKKLLSVKF
jgi:2'-5' RNA ligase